MNTATMDDATARLTTRFSGDIRGLLRRHHVPCAGEQDLGGLSDALFQNAAFRSDLFALCTSISHMADRDLSEDELLDLVVASYGPGLTASAESRAMFNGAFQGWHARERAVEPAVPVRETPAVATTATPLNEMDQTLQRISESSLELKLFLTDVKQRVTEIDPELVRLERMLAQMRPAAAVTAAEREVPVTLPETLVHVGEEKRVRHLRMAVVALSAALVLALGLGGVAWLTRGVSGTQAVAPAPIVEGAPRQTEPGTATLGAEAKARSTPRPQRVVKLRSAAPGAGKRTETHEVARVPAPIVRRDPDHRQTPETHTQGPVFVPGSTMIGYALASPKPKYPAVSVPDDKASRVEVQATISPTGEVVETHVLSGPVLFREAAEHALQEWRFRPYLVDGNPVKVSTTVAFVFRSMPTT